MLRMCSLQVCQKYMISLMNRVDFFLFLSIINACIQGDSSEIRNMICFLYFRETGVYILSAVDDIQVMMDDHILKAQTMRGSPYVKAFEAEMQAWEEKLISMQDILEQWLMVSRTI